MCKVRECTDFYTRKPRFRDATPRYSGQKGVLGAVFCLSARFDEHFKVEPCCVVTRCMLPTCRNLMVWCLYPSKWRQWLLSTLFSGQIHRTVLFDFIKAIYWKLRIWQFPRKLSTKSPSMARSVTTSHWTWYKLQAQPFSWYNTSEHFCDTRFSSQSIWTILSWKHERAWIREFLEGFNVTPNLAN